MSENDTQQPESTNTDVTTEDKESIRDILRQEISSASDPNTKSIAELIRSATDKQVDERLAKFSRLITKAPWIAILAVIATMILNVLAPNLYHIYLDIQTPQVKSEIYAALKSYTDKTTKSYIHKNGTLDEYNKRIEALNERISAISDELLEFDTKIIQESNNLSKKISISDESLKKKVDNLDDLNDSIVSIVATYKERKKNISKKLNGLEDYYDSIVSAQDKLDGASGIISRLENAQKLYKGILEDADSQSVDLGKRIANHLKNDDNDLLERIFSSSLPVGVAMVFPISDSDAKDMRRKERDGGGGSLPYFEYCAKQGLEFAGISLMAKSLAKADAGELNEGLAITCVKGR